MLPSKGLPVIPPKRNRVTARSYDKTRYAFRHRIENPFLSLTQWRGISFRYAKMPTLSLAAIHIRCFILWSSKLI
jgi:transposase